jgi:predicted PurR-regulated permease PerM
MNGPVQAAHSLRAFLAVVVTVAVLRYAEEVFVPLALAILLTFLLAPLVEKLQRWGINRAVAVIVSVSLAVLILGGLAWVVFQQFVDLVSELPRYRQQLRANLGDLTSALRGGVSETTQAVEQLTRELSRAAPGSRGASQIPKVEVVEPTTPVESLRQLIEPMVKPVTTAALVLVFVIFMLLRLPDLRDRVISLLGSKNLRVTTEALDEAARKVSQYIVMQTVINGWQGILTAIGLYLIGVPNAVLWGALSMVLRFIPYVGIWVAAAMPVTLSFALFDNWAQPLPRARGVQLCGARAMALWEPYGRLADRSACGSRVLDVALGAYRTASRHPHHRLPRGDGQIHSSARFPARAARGPARVGAS